MPLHLHLPRNPAAGRDLIVGDIHGHFGKLSAALDAVRFDPSRDRLISVGDLVDRGPDSEQALDWLAQPWFHAVRGNHEAMCIEAFADPKSAALVLLYANGGEWFVELTTDGRRTFAEAFKALPVAITLDTAEGPVGVVHADCPLDSWPDFVAALERDADAVLESAVWSRARWACSDLGLPASRVSGVRAVVVGHTPVSAPLVVDNVHFIDTGGWRGYDFTLLDASTLQPIRA